MKHFITAFKALFFISFLISCNNDSPADITRDLSNEISDQKVDEVIKENVANFPNNNFAYSFKNDEGNVARQFFTNS